MSVRREVVSLSRLLQQRKDDAVSARRGEGVDQVQHAVVSNNSVVVRANAHEPRPLAAMRGLQMPPVRPPQQPQRVMPRSSLGYMQKQPAIQAAYAGQLPPPIDGMTAYNDTMYSSEAYEDANTFTSQSQSQSQSLSQSQSQSTMMYSQEDVVKGHVGLRQNKYFQMLHEPGKFAQETTKERERIEESIMTRIWSPLQKELGGISARVDQQAETQKNNNSHLECISADIAELASSIQKLSEQRDDVKSHCEQCHKKTLESTDSINSAVDRLRSRLDAIEANIRAFTGDVSTLISEERTRRAKRAYAFDEFDEFSRENMRTNHRRSRSRSTAQRRRGQSPMNPGSSPDQAIPVVDNQERSPVQIPLFDDNYDDGGSSDEDDEYGVHYARKCIEDARAKRRKESIWS